MGLAFFMSSSTPLDQLQENRTGLVKVARVFSNVVSPPTIFAALGIAFGLRDNLSWIGFGWSAVYGVLVSLVPILLVVYLLLNGYIKELHMSDTRERIIPYISSVVCGGLAWLIFAQFNGPEPLRCLSMMTAGALAVIGVINIYWLISFHATAVFAAVVLAYVGFSPLAGFLTLILAFIVCAARLFLKRHTPAQLVAGAILGLVAASWAASTGCFG